MGATTVESTHTAVRPQKGAIMALVTTREITTDECPWLEKNIPAGTTVQRGSDHYGCCSPSGVPVEIDGHNGFVEVPRDAVTASK